MSTAAESVPSPNEIFPAVFPPISPGFTMPLHIKPNMINRDQIKSAWALNFIPFLSSDFNGRHAEITKLENDIVFVSVEKQNDGRGTCSKYFWGTLKVVGWMTLILPLIAYIAVKIFRERNQLVNEGSRLTLGATEAMTAINERNAITREKNELAAANDKLAAELKALRESIGSQPEAKRESEEKSDKAKSSKLIDGYKEVNIRTARRLAARDVSLKEANQKISAQHQRIVTLEAQLGLGIPPASASGVSPAKTPAAPPRVTLSQLETLEAEIKILKDGKSIDERALKELREQLSQQAKILTEQAKQLQELAPHAPSSSSGSGGGASAGSGASTHATVAEEQEFRKKIIREQMQYFSAVEINELWLSAASSSSGSGGGASAGSGASTHATVASTSSGS